MSRLHFRCSFDVVSKGRDCSREILLKAIRKWIAQRPKPRCNDFFWKAWFFQGGQWKSRRHPGIRVLTRVCRGNCSSQSPDCWAAEYEHPCDEFPNSRFWRVHIGIECLGHDRFRFNLQTLHDMRPGYLGPEPMAPLPSSPGLVKTLLTSDLWSCTAGSGELSVFPRVLRVGEGHFFADLIAHPERTCPVILVSQKHQNQGFTIDPGRLAKLLAGTAIVYESENSEVDEELDNLIGERLSCRKGAIRVYVPRLDLNRPGEERRHRFILPRDVNEWGADRTIEIIVRGIARRAIRPRGVLTPMDVEGVKSQRRLIQLRSRQIDGSKDDWIELANSLDEENATLKGDKTRLEDEVDRLGEHLDELDERLRRVNYENDSLKANCAQANGAMGTSNSRVILEKLRELPRSLAEVVDVIGAVYPERIAFTERAVKSAGESDFDDVYKAWRGLWEMATTLYDLCFGPGSGDIAKIFRDRTGIEVAMTEGKLTKKDNRKMAQRKDAFMGEEIDITPHVKLDRGTARAYFCAFRQNGTQRIVVGDIGDHLETAGTRRRRK